MSISWNGQMVATFPNNNKKIYLIYRPKTKLKIFQLGNFLLDKTEKYLRRVPPHQRLFTTQPTDCEGENCRHRIEPDK